MGILEAIDPLVHCMCQHLPETVPTHTVSVVLMHQHGYIRDQCRDGTDMPINPKHYETAYNS